MTGPAGVLSTLGVGLAVATAVGAWLGSRGRPVRRMVAGRPGADGRRWRPRVAVRRRSREPPERRLSALVTDVTALLRTGVDPATAWRQAGVAVGPTGVPTPGAIRAAVGQAGGQTSRDGRAERWAGWEIGGPGLDASAGRGESENGRGPGRGRRSPGLEQHVAAVVAAARVAALAGTPLVRVLEQVAAGLEVDQEVEAERRVALAGPRATARLLAWLPVAGLLLGALVGADPVEVALGGGVGTVAVVAGAALLALGRVWVAREVRAARRAADRR